VIRFHPIRAAALRTVLDHPDTEWTTTSLTTAAGHDEAARTTVRELILTLMNERLMEPVPYQRALTVRLRSGAETSIRMLLSRWGDEAARRNSQVTA
jgi:hypothetical protein